MVESEGKNVVGRKRRAFPRHSPPDTGGHMRDYVDLGRLAKVCERGLKYTHLEHRRYVANPGTGLIR